eukprot:TRINITY_DN4016_c0_g1_i5.p1 TRINITY_DN4016_c0_g1~~TRINITY_DN4016_c0_g1_i5.p1  ORF type:complete len:203 (+),score=57.71 TRINITY_DN4016_c0_g1_i5:1084-1692(+)
MLRKELEAVNGQKAEVETSLEALQHRLKHVKEENVKELEKKYKHEVKELKYMVYMLMKSKKMKKEFSVEDKVRKKISGKTKSIQGKVNENKAGIKELEKQNEKLHSDNYALSQEIQYLQFKLKVNLVAQVECDRSGQRERDRGNTEQRDGPERKRSPQTLLRAKVQNARRPRAALERRNQRPLREAGQLFELPKERTCKVQR